MNFIRSKARNKMDPERMDKLAFVRCNRIQLEKQQKSELAASNFVDQDILDDALDDEELGWSDEWQEALQEEEIQEEGMREERIARSRKRADSISKQVNKRIIPSKPASDERLAQASELRVAMQAAAEGVAPEVVRSRRSGREIRAPTLMETWTGRKCMQTHSCLLDVPPTASRLVCVDLASRFC